MEERMLSRHARLLDGRLIYAMLMRAFTKDVQLAKTEALNELHCVQAGESHNALHNFMSK